VFKKILLLSLLVLEALTTSQASFNNSWDNNNNDASTTRAASNSIQEPEAATNTKLRQGGFPNYFEHVPQDQQVDLLEKSFKSLIYSMDVPHLKQDQEILKSKGFFDELVSLVKQTDKDAKIYLSGNTITHLLGAIYKKLYQSHLNGLIHNQNPNLDPSVQNTVLTIFNRLISEHGSKVEKRRNFLKVMGPQCRFDILIDFSSSATEQNKQDIIQRANNFINSTKHFLESSDHKNAYKYVIPPVGDVKDYQKLVTDQGGMTLGWLAYDLVEHKIRTPEGYQDILQNLFPGKTGLFGST
jgi:hypothetical protein